jgi:hypothetical protein
MRSEHMPMTNRWPLSFPVQPISCHAQALQHPRSGYALSTVAPAKRVRRTMAQSRKCEPALVLLQTGIIPGRPRTWAHQPDLHSPSGIGRAGGPSTVGHCRPEPGDDPAPAHPQCLMPGPQPYGALVIDAHGYRVHVMPGAYSAQASLYLAAASPRHSYYSRPGTPYGGGVP